MRCGYEEGRVANYFIGADQKMSDWLTKIMFRESLKEQLDQMLNISLIFWSLVRLPEVCKYSL